MWRRGGAVAASVLLGAGCMLAAAHPAAAVNGSFTIVGGRTRWSFDQGQPITITGTTTTPDPGPVTALLDDNPTGSGSADSSGNFSLTFTLPDTTCADGEANTHQVGVAFSDGSSLPPQQIVYRCANYTAQPEFDGNANVYSELIDIDRAGGPSPVVATCIQATDPHNGDPLGQVVETGAPPSTLVVSATYTATNQSPSTVPLQPVAAGAGVSRTDVAGCYLYNLPQPPPVAAPYSVALSATLPTSSTAGPTARVLAEQLAGPDCVTAGSPVFIKGFGFGDAQLIDLTYAYTAPPSSGPRFRIAGIQRAHIATANPPAPAGDHVISRPDGSISDSYGPVSGAAADGTLLVKAYLLLSDGSGVLLTQFTVTFADACGNPENLTITPKTYAAVPVGANRYVQIVAHGLGASQPVTATVNTHPVTFVNGSHYPLTDPVTDVNGNYAGTLQIPAADVDCRQANTVELSTPGSGGTGIAGPVGNEDIAPFYVTCASIAAAAAAHPAVTGDEIDPVLTGFDESDVIPDGPRMPVLAGLSTGTAANGSFTPVPGTQTETVYEESMAAAYPVFLSAPLTCGAVTNVVATEESDTTSYDAPPATSLPVVPLCSGDPTLTAAPAAFAFSTGSRQLTLSGSGLRPRSTQNLAIDGQPTTPATATVGPNGTLAATVSESGLECGSHTVTSQTLMPSYGSAATDDLPAIAVITVSCPSATLAPAPLVEERLPEPVTVSGVGYDPGSQVTITLPNGQNATATVGSTGTLPATTFSSGSLPCGTGVATVTETGQPVTPQPSAQAAYVVQCPAPPTLAVSPPTIAGTTGQRTVTVTGTGWLPKTSLPLTFDGSPLTTVSVDAGGTFSAPVTLTAPSPVSHTVSAVQGEYRSASALVRVTTPSISATPSSFSRTDEPSSIAVSGSGYDPGYALTLDVPGVNSLAVVADSTGAFTSNVPTSKIACGPDQTITATEPVTGGAPFTVGPVATTPLAVTCAATPTATPPSGTAPGTPPGHPVAPRLPTVTPSPGTFAFTPPGRPVTLHGGGFRPGTQVIITGTGIPTRTVVSDAAGNLKVTVPATGACGRYSVVVTPTSGSAVSTSYTVTCPALVSQPTALEGLHLPDTVSVTGSGYDPDSLVTLVLAQPNLPPISVAVRTDAGGALKTPFPVAELFCAPAPITGTESYPATPAPTATVLDTVACPTPTLTVNPRTIDDGQVAIYEGTNFHPGENVELVWKLSDGTNGLGDCQATVAPDTTISGGCLVFPHDVLGKRTLVATDERAAIGRASVLIQSNPTEPGREDQNGSGLSLLSRR